MKAENRRVYLFIAVGLIAAAAIGYGVWRAGAPSAPSASDTATVTTEVSRISESARQIQTTPAAEDPTVPSEDGPQPRPPAVADDPYLAPHAVVQAAPTDIGPTVVYRPENIVPTTLSAEPTDLTGTQEAREAGSGGPAPTTAFPTEPTDAPADTPGPSPTTEEDTDAFVAPTDGDSAPQPTADTTTAQAPAGSTPEATQAPAGSTPEAGQPTTTADPTEPAAEVQTTPQPTAPAPTGDATGPAATEQPVEGGETTDATSAPDVEQAAVPQQRTSWWPLSNWFNFGS